jgi:hypothetical protein
MVVQPTVLQLAVVVATSPLLLEEQDWQLQLAVLQLAVSGLVAVLQLAVLQLAAL